jgi:hypothetical protein
MAVSMEMRVNSAPEIAERVVLRLDSHGPGAKCVFADCGPLSLPNHVAPFIRVGDILQFPPNMFGGDEGVVVYVRKPKLRHDLLFAEIDYAGRVLDCGRDGPLVTADVRNKALGIPAIHLRCDILRDYFYVGDRRRGWDQQPSFYELLRTEPSATPSEVRVAYRLRTLELRATRGSPADVRSLERAFNMLYESALRESYNELLRDAEVPIPFPHNGFGSLLVEGGCQRDRRVFVASRILSFRPHQSLKTIRAPLRNCTFYKHLAVYRDIRRRIEILLDPCVLPLSWEPSWNRWKHLVGLQAEIKSVFVETGKYRHRRGTWQLQVWETALPSRIELKVPGDASDRISKSRNNYLRFGQFADAFEAVRRDLESAPLERNELQQICARLGVPSDFDVSLITWKPDYEEFYYKQLCRWARRLYLFRAEYIFDLEALVVIETPQLGHATYLFSKPKSMNEFLATYRSTTREEILQNRNNVAEALGFLNRIIHGPNAQTWLADLRAHLGPKDAVEVL